MRVSDLRPVAELVAVLVRPLRLLVVEVQPARRRAPASACNSPGLRDAVVVRVPPQPQAAKTASRLSITPSPLPPLAGRSKTASARKPLGSSPAGGAGCGVKLPNNSCPLSIAPLPLRSKASHASSAPAAVQRKPLRCAVAVEVERDAARRVRQREAVAAHVHEHRRVRRGRVAIPGARKGVPGVRRASAVAAAAAARVRGGGAGAMMMPSSAAALARASASASGRRRSACCRRSSRSRC